LRVERLSATVAAVLLTVLACGESIAPGSGYGIVVPVLSARSPTSQTGTVGEEAEPPEVAVLDTAGRPVSGVRVSFHVVNGNGTISASSALSNSTGVASLTRWVLGTAAGLNLVVATAGSGDPLFFHATTLPGPPALLVKVGFDGVPEAPEGTALAVSPRVRLTDQFGNGVPGTEVKFTVEAGGGSLTRDRTRTDSVGVAESGSWTLGGTGSQRVVAGAGSLASEAFTAFARPRPFGCASESIVLRTSVTSDLTPASCRSPDGRTVALYSLQLLAPTAVTFRMTSSAFDTYLELRDVDLQELARNDNVSQLQANSAFKAVLPAGMYTLVATSAGGGAEGRFTVTVDQVPESVSGCEEVFVARKLVTMQTAYSSDCVRAPYSYTDRFTMYLYQGTHVEITVEDWNYTGPNVEFITSSGTSVFGSTTANYVRLLSYTADQSGYYTFHVGLAADENQDYKLIIR
jgi:hypothetical protein